MKIKEGDKMSDTSKMVKQLLNMQLKIQEDIDLIKKEQNEILFSLKSTLPQTYNPDTSNLTHKNYFYSISPKQ